MGEASVNLRADAIRLLKVGLRDPAGVVAMSPTDLDLLLQLLRRVRLHGRFAADLKQAGVFGDLPQVAQDQLNSVLVMAESRNRVALWELNRIAWAMRDEQRVKLSCMKGCAYLLLALPNARGRIFADVDLLIQEDQLEHVERVLNARGWKTQSLSAYDDNYYRRWTHELPPLVHVERDVEIDLHHNIVPRTARLKPSSHDLFENTTPVKGSRYHVLRAEDLVLHAMVHLMFDSDLADKLRDLVDIEEMLRHFAGRENRFWRRLVARAGELGLGRPLYYSLRYARRLLDSQIPQGVIERTESWEPITPIRWLMDRLVPLALLPPHPGYPDRGADLARFLLFMRSHWLRMPPWLLVYHLSYKFCVTRFRRTVVGRGDA